METEEEEAAIVLFDFGPDELSCFTQALYSIAPPFLFAGIIEPVRALLHTSFFHLPSGSEFGGSFLLGQPDEDAVKKKALEIVTRMRDKDNRHHYRRRESTLT